ncbi:hypothetical protein ACHAXR_009253 [Thalassiosira sp. AJA248-18]
MQGGRRNTRKNLPGGDSRLSSSTGSTRGDRVGNGIGDGQERRAGRGRGSGGNSSRGRHGQKSKNATKQQGQDNEGGNKNHGSINKATPLIESADFQTNFHAKLCRSARYKVHAPFCSCSKVVKLRQRHCKNNAGGVQSSRKDEKIILNNDTSIMAPTAHNTDNNAYYSNGVQFDIDGNFSHQLGQLNLTSSNDEGGSSSNININNNDPFDNLIVVPDTKSPQAIYFCEGTDRKQFERDGTACENKMAGEIFGIEEQQDGGNIISQVKVAISNDDGNSIPPFKVNCAICLLTTHQRNGFVAIVSHSLEELQPTIQRARDATLDKVQHDGRELHADHAHFVCALALPSLQTLLAAGKTRKKDQHVAVEILTQMKDGGVDLPAETTSSSNKSTPFQSVQIEMGHHLTSLLWLLQKRQSTEPMLQKENGIMNRHHLQYIMVMGYIDSPHNFTLDLPGGKRHLGESTLQGAIREVEEECSLPIDQEWVASRVLKQYGGNLTVATDRGEERNEVQVLEPRKVKGGESGDAFFVMAPLPRKQNKKNTVSSLRGK